MVRSWLAYLLTLACGAAFYLFYPKPFSLYTLLLLLVLPVLSVGLTLLSLRRFTLDVSSRRPSLLKDAPASLTLTLQGSKSAGGVTARLSLRLENKLYPQLSEVKRLSLTCNVPLSLPLPTGHCGWLSLAVERCVLTDWLGLFSLPVKTPSPALVLVWPQSAPTAGTLPDLTPAQGRPLRPRPGGGPGEDYELRPYRPGDAVASIHWKLTAKQPEDAGPVLRETMEPLEEALAVTYDHFGDPQDVDAVLGQLDALEHCLIEAGRPFTLCWADPENGRLTHYTIDCPDAWQRCFRTLAGIPAPRSGQGIPEGMPLTLPGQSGSVRRIHLTLPQKEVSP